MAMIPHLEKKKTTMHHKTKRQIFKAIKVFKDKNVRFFKSMWQVGT